MLRFRRSGKNFKQPISSVVATGSKFLGQQILGYQVCSPNLTEKGKHMQEVMFASFCQ